MSSAPAPLSHPIVGFLAFQVCWFACVGGAARGLPWLGPLAVAVYLAIRALMIPSPREWTRQAWLLGQAGAIGYAADSLLVLAGVLTFPAHAVLGRPSSLWMVALWVLQAATLRDVMPWMEGRFVLGALVGAVGGPLAYLAGERMGAAVLGPTHVTAIAVIAVEWAAAMPALLWLSERTLTGAEAARLVKGSRLAP